MVTKDEFKRIRDERGETQAEFAVHFGVNQATIQRWETRGFPPYRAFPQHLRTAYSERIERIIEGLKPQVAAE